MALTNMAFIINLTHYKTPTMATGNEEGEEATPACTRRDFQRGGA